MKRKMMKINKQILCLVARRRPHSGGDCRTAIGFLQPGVNICLNSGLVAEHSLSTGVAGAGLLRGAARLMMGVCMLSMQLCVPAGVDSVQDTVDRVVGICWLWAEPRRLWLRLMAFLMLSPMDFVLLWDLADMFGVPTPEALLKSLSHCFFFADSGIALNVA